MHGTTVQITGLADLRQYKIILCQIFDSYRYPHLLHNILMRDFIILMKAIFQECKENYLDSNQKISD